MPVTLSKADLLAVERKDDDFINSKGAEFYRKGDYESAIEYYRLAAAMGNVYAVSNLGYCYMYARSVPKNMSLAMAYFSMAARRGNVDAMYKLGNIYENGAEEVEKDPETAIYYYRMAIRTIDEYDENPRLYPSVYYSMAKACMPGGMLVTDLKNAYKFLNIAKRGYEIEEADGIKYHKGAYEATLRLLSDECFDTFRDEDDFDEEFDVDF